MNHTQTLVIQSGHPLGLFVSHETAPRVILSNGLMIGQFNDSDNWNKPCLL